MKSTYEAYYEAPQAIRDLIDTGLIGNSVEKILSETTYIALKPKVIIACTRNFLSLTSSEELLKELRDLNLSEITIQTLALENRKLLSESLHDISQGIESAIIGTTKQTSKDLASIAYSDSNIQKEISDAEAALNTLPPIRVFHTNDSITPKPVETVYTSTQSAILEEGRMRSVNTPTTSGGTAPRWDSAK